MQMIGMILMGIGGLVSAVGAIWVLVVAFKQSVVWGLCSFFIPFVIFVFIVKYWGKAKKPFFIYLAGVALIIGGVVLGGNMPKVG